MPIRSKTLVFISFLIYSVWSINTPPSAISIKGNRQRGASPEQDHLLQHLEILQQRLRTNRERREGQAQQPALPLEPLGHNDVVNNFVLPLQQPFLDAETQGTPPIVGQQQLQLDDDVPPQFLDLPELNELNRDRSIGQPQQEALQPLQRGHDDLVNNWQGLHMPLLDAEAQEALPPLPPARHQPVQLFNDPLPQDLRMPELINLDFFHPEPYGGRMEAHDNSVSNLIPLSPQQHQFHTPDQASPDKNAVSRTSSKTFTTRRIPR
jgi:hypothetical protein